MLHDLLYPKHLISVGGRTSLIEARFRDTLGFICASRQIEQELRGHRYEAVRRPQGYHIGMKLPLSAVLSFIKSPWQRLRQSDSGSHLANAGYHENFCIHDNATKSLVGIAALQGNLKHTPEIRVFVRSNSYRQHPENAFLMLAQIARDTYGATQIEVVTDRPQALSRYGFTAKEDKPLRRNAPNWMVAPISQILQP